jgi:predicted amidophosphoribosyltransferase
VLKSAGPCSGCGAPLPTGARFCTICGTVAG